MSPKCTARAFATGRLPGRPRHTGHVRVLGGSPKVSSQPQNIFVAVASCTWISRPITASSAVAPEGPAPAAAEAAARSTPAPLDMRGAPVEGERQLERVRGVEQRVLAEGGARDLQAHRKAVAEPARDRD